MQLSRIPCLRILFKTSLTRFVINKRRYVLVMQNVNTITIYFNLVPLVFLAW